MLVEWSCTNKIINGRGLYILVEWSCRNKRNKSVGTLNSDRMVVHIASAKIPKSERNISPSSFYGQLPDYYSHAFSLIYPVEEFFLKEMRTCGLSKISCYCFCVWCESRKSRGRGSSRFSCATPVVEISDKVTFS